MKHVMIPFKDLRPSKTNPRTMHADLAPLVASIKAHGLIQPLVVQWQEGHPVVIAGNRRLAALEAALEDEEQLVSCVDLGANPNADAIALAENVERANLHPLDEAEAFKRLLKAGDTVEDLSNAFGYSIETIKRRIALAELAPAVKKLFRNHEIKLAVAQAFTVVPQKQQIAFLNSLTDNSRWMLERADQIRSHFKQDYIDTAHALFEPSSVPAAAFLHDLFKGDTAIERDVFIEHQDAAIEKLIESLELEGWDKVIRIDEATERWRFREVPVDLPKKIKTKIDRLVAQIDDAETKISAIEDEYYESSSEADEAKTEQAQAAYEKKIEKIEAQRDAKQAEVKALIAEHGFHSDETKAKACTLVYVHHPRYEVEVLRGMVPHDKKTAATHGVTGETSKAETAAAPPAPKTCNDLTRAQTEALLCQCIFALRSFFATDGQKSLAFALTSLEQPGAFVTLNDPTRGFAEGFTSRPGNAEFEIDKTFPDVAQYVVKDTTVATFGNLKSEPEPELLEVFAGLFAERLDVHDGVYQGFPVDVVELMNTLGLSIRAFWTPNAHWLGKYRKDQLLDLLKTIGLESHIASHGNDKKTGLVKHIAGIFAGAQSETAASYSKEVRARINSWCPMLVPPA